MAENVKTVMYLVSFTFLMYYEGVIQRPTFIKSKERWKRDLKRKFHKTHKIRPIYRPTHTEKRIKKKRFSQLISKIRLILSIREYKKHFLLGSAFRILLCAQIISLHFIFNIIMSHEFGFFPQKTFFFLLRQGKNIKKQGKFLRCYSSKTFQI